MSLSTAEIAAIVDALRRDLVGARVRQARAVANAPGSVVLELRTPGANHHLLLSADAGVSRLHRIAEVPTQPSSPPAFVMLLRKHVVGRAITELTQLGDDRVVQIATGPRDDDDAHPPVIVAELTGRHGNLFAIRDGRILGALLPNKSRRRDLRPGAEYAPPVSAARPGRFREDWPDTDAEAFVDERYQALSAAARVDRARSAQLRAARKALGRARRALEAVRGDLAAIAEADTVRRRAELLRGAWGAVERGADRVSVQDWSAPGAPNVEVPLDPSLDLDANIKSLFARYKRLKRGEDPARARERELSARVEELERLVERVAEASSEDLATTGAEVERATGDTHAGRRRGPAETRTPYHAFRSTDGLEILVGKRARDNDVLTFRVARGNDIWMHAADWPGSHVIVRVPRGGTVPPRTLLEAALLTAHYSKGRDDTLVAVTWTERKHVRKPKGAPPGRVTVAGGRTIEVRPDPAIVAVLSGSWSRA